MRTLKLAVTILLLGLAAKTASAFTPVTPPPQTYMFTANPGETTIYNGSTIELQGTSSTTGIALLDWNLLGWSGGPVTPGNSAVGFQNFSFYDPSTFYGSFDINGFSSFGDFFFGSNDAVNGGFLQVEGDPPGVWSAAPVAGVPDAGSAFQLLAIALGGLAAARRWVGARA